MINYLTKKLNRILEGKVSKSQLTLSHSLYFKYRVLLVIQYILLSYLYKVL